MYLIWGDILSRSRLQDFQFSLSILIKAFHDFWIPLFMSHTQLSVLLFFLWQWCVLFLFLVVFKIFLPSFYYHFLTIFTIFLPSFIFSALAADVVLFYFFWCGVGYTPWVSELVQWISFGIFSGVLKILLLPHSFLNYSYIELFDSHVSFALFFSLIFFPLCFSLDVFCWSLQDHKSCVFVFSQLQNWSTDFLISDTIFFNSKITIWLFLIAFNSLLKFPFFHLLWTFFCIFNLY